MYEIVNAHTTSQGVSDGISCVKVLEKKNLTGGWSKVGKNKFPKNIVLSENDQDASKRRNSK